MFSNAKSNEEKKKDSSGSRLRGTQLDGFFNRLSLGKITVSFMDSSSDNFLSTTPSIVPYNIPSPKPHFLSPGFFNMSGMRSSGLVPLPPQFLGENNSPSNLPECKTSEIAKDSSINKLKINCDAYLYHTIGGFNLFKLMSILKKGILSKEAASEKGISIDSSGLAENGSNRVSLSNSQALATKSYAGEHLSLVVDPKGLKCYKPLSSNALFHEIQVYDSVPPENIVGIMIPHEYLLKDLANLQILDSYTKERLELNVNNLDSFLKSEFSCSIFTDANVNRSYTEALQGVEWDTSTEDYFEHEHKHKRIIENLNADLMAFIIDIYKKALQKTDIDLIDLIKYHATDKYPIYDSSGHAITDGQSIVMNRRLSVL